MSAPIDRRPGAPGWQPALPGTLLADVAGVMQVRDVPSAFADSPVQEVRELYATWWISQGFSDASEVKAWVDAGVESADTAANAVEAGYRPGDPWVEQTGQQFYFEERVLQRPGRVRAMLNRRRARREWEERQAMLQRGSDDMVAMAQAIDEHGGSPLAVLAFLASADSPVTPEHVWRALAELDMQLAAWPHDEDEPIEYWQAMIQVIDRSAHFCEPQDRDRIRGALLDVSAAIGRRSSSR